ncbi:MAG: helicase-related protein [Candidatus Norongarragalinales archaeon]
MDLQLLKKTGIELRDYQVKAAEKLFETRRLLVVMPTALGKTFVAILAIAHLLKTQEKKILFLAPTKPLVLQQAKRLAELIESTEETVVVTGEMPPEERKKKYVQATVICATPQTIENDLKMRRLSLEDFALVVFDEAHRAIGDYAYSFIGGEVQKTGALVLALTASPSSERKKISEVCRSLGVSAVEIKTAEDEDVKGFAKEVKVFYEFVDLPPEIIDLRKRLQEILYDPLSKLSERGFAASKTSASRKQLLFLRIKFLEMAKRNPSFYPLLSETAKALNIVHAIDLLESEGIKPLLSFIQGMDLRKTTTKAVLALSKDPRIAKIKKECERLLDKRIEHPKMILLKDYARKIASSGKNAIVFAHYRDSVSYLISELNALPGVKARALVGRSEKGMTQKEQHAVVESFRNGDFNFLVATSVGEEGLDIPSVDMVIFFEAVPSEIRLIQRRGRAGRTHVGEAVVFVSKGTKDEAYLWISKNKEKKMHKHLQRMQHSPHEDFGAEEKTKQKRKGQTKIGDF